MPPKSHAFNNKKAKLYNSRTIRSENHDPSFKDGVLTVPEFLSSREFEIKAFELSQLSTKASSSTRVFQSLPRSLRRRAASHNVKRIPKRLRNKAIREMQNTINGVPPKKQHLRGRELYRLRMSKKLLKLASRIKLMKHLPRNEVADKLKLREKLKILDQQLKELEKKGQKDSTLEELVQQENEPKIQYLDSSSLNNTVGSYDNCSINGLAPRPRGNLKYTKRQKEFVWIPTHMWHVKRFHMVKKWGFQIPLSPSQKCFRAVNRSSKKGCLLYDTSFLSTCIIEANSRESFMQVLSTISKYQSKPFPKQFLNGVKSKSYDNWLYVNGRKYLKGTILAVESGHKILVRVHPSGYEELFENYKDYITGNNLGQIVDCRYSIGSFELNGPKALYTLSRVLHFCPQSAHVKKNWNDFSSCQDNTTIPSGTTFSFSVKDPRYWKHPVSPPTNVKHSKGLYESIINHPVTIDTSSVQRLIDGLGRQESYRNQKSIKDLGKLFARANPSSNCLTKGTDEEFPVVIIKLSTGNWAVLLPWFWVLPTWIKLAALSSVTVGGQRQLHQINYERGIPTFPTDYPFLKQGWIENELKALVQTKKNKKKMSPLEVKFEGKVATMKNDWTLLQRLRMGILFLSQNSYSTDDSKKNFAVYDEKTNKRRITSVHDILEVLETSRSEQPQEELNNIAIELYEKANPVHEAFVNNQLTSIDQNDFPRLPVIQVKLTVEGKGHIHDNARIYTALSDSQHNYGNLVGFVTSGTFNLNFGKSTAIGLLSAEVAQNKLYIRNVNHSNYYPVVCEKV